MRTAARPNYRRCTTSSTQALAAVLESNAAVAVRFEYDDYRVVIGPDPLEGAVIDRDR